MSSLKDLASLIMVPSLYKDGELHTVKPLGNSILHPDATGNHDGTDGSTPAEGNFTFSRGSNLAATRVDVNGLIEKGRENLLLQSNNFINPNWANYLGATGSVTGGQLGYDGSNDAWLIEKEATTYRRIQQSVSASGVWTMSVYAKAGTTNIFRFRDNTSDNMVQFDLSTGIAINAGSNTPIDLGMENVGNDWYRCYWSHSASISIMQIYVGWAETDSVNFYIQDAQLEAGLVATDYIETGASTAQAGILEDMPRLDYSGSCPALLLEPSRTNIQPYSEYFGHSIWAKNDVSVEFGYLAPDGTNTAYKVTKTGSNAHLVNTTTSGNTGNIKSIYAKTTSGTGTILLFNSVDTYFTITEEWQRFDIQHDGIDFFYAADFRNASTLTEIIIWGAQSESGSYPTSYIPTYGSSVTRSGEGRVNQLASPITFAAGENFTLYFEGEFNPLNPLPMLMGGRTTSNAYWWITSNTGSGGKLSSDSGTEMATYTGGSITPYTRHKFLVKRDSNVITFYQDGVALTTTQGSGVADAWTFQSLGYGFNNVGTYSFSGKAYQAAIYPTALTDSECIALTTL